MPDSDVLDNFESALKSAFYMHVRHLYNRNKQYGIKPEFTTAVFYFIREFCFASMFRYNREGEFNVPYGGIQYNRKDFLKKINILKSDLYNEHLKRTKIFNMDFEEFLNDIQPLKDDFIFLDPPYDSDFSTYMKNDFSKKDHLRLANYLFQCPAKFILVIKSTPYILDLYWNSGLNIASFDKRYLVSFMNRNDQTAEHLLISNYPVRPQLGKKTQ
jgi:DNA adenine methylase